jgi:hypothetical protein
MEVSASAKTAATSEIRFSTARNLHGSGSL